MNGAPRDGCALPGGGCRGRASGWARASGGQRSLGGRCPPPSAPPGMFGDKEWGRQDGMGRSLYVGAGGGGGGAAAWRSRVPSGLVGPKGDGREGGEREPLRWSGAQVAVLLGMRSFGRGCAPGCVGQGRMGGEGELLRWDRARVAVVSGLWPAGRGVACGTLRTREEGRGEAAQVLMLWAGAQVVGAGLRPEGHGAPSAMRGRRNDGRRRRGRGTVRWRGAWAAAAVGFLARPWEGCGEACDQGEGGARRDGARHPDGAGEGAGGSEWLTGG